MKKKISLLKPVAGYGLFLVIVISVVIVGPRRFLTEDLKTVVGDSLTVFGVITAFISALALYLSIYNPNLRKRFMGEFGWGNVIIDGDYPLLEGVEPDTVALITPLSFQNNQALFLINHLLPLTIHLVYSDIVARNTTDNPFTVFDNTPRLGQDKSRYSENRSDIASNPLDFYSFEDLYENAVKIIAKLKKDFKPHDIYVDTTGGTAIVSMAHLQAAISEGVNVVYTKGCIKGPPGSTPQIAWKDPTSGQVILIQKAKHSESDAG